MCSSRGLLKTGIYRTKTPISKFKCRFLIQEMSTLITIPDLKGYNKDLENERKLEYGLKVTCNIRWQEKIFSRHEIEYYGAKQNCKTECQRMYHNKLKFENHDSDILFTYVDGDNFFPNYLHYRSLGHHLSKVLKSNAEAMHLMADVGQQVLLFSIYWFPKNKILLVYPDFNRMSVNPYYREVRGSNVQVYHYALEKCNLTEVYIPATDLTLKGSSSRTFAYSALMRKEMFFIPQMLQRNLLVLLEIINATAFSYDSLHIRYQIELPDGIKITEENDKLLGSTHSSKHCNGLWQFGHCHELYLSMVKWEEHHQPSIKLLLEAISIDNWQRERNLGQAHLSIQLCTQKSQSALKFVQLTHQDTLFDRFEAFLVGNHRKQDSLSFYGKNGRSVLNRYGNETIASGTVEIRYQVIRQHEPKVLNVDFYNPTRKTNNITVQDLLATYTAARERLEEFIELKY